jgi:hypothetical protein
MTTHTKLSADEARRLAVQGDVDPRSLIAVLEGRRVRGMAGRRARRVLEQNGYLPQAPVARAPKQQKDGGAP